MSKRKHHFVDKALKVPKCDFPSLSSSSESKAKANDTHATKLSSSPPLLLVQLPASLSTDELTKSRVLVQDSKCRIISEEKGVTFDLVKVETSNAYVLIRDSGDGDEQEHEQPQQEKENDTNMNGNANANANDSEEISPQKNSNETEARLLRESNTFFLECLPANNQEELELEVSNILKKHVYPPPARVQYRNRYRKQSQDQNESLCGVTVEDLSLRLMYSKRQITNVLEKMQAFPIPLLVPGTESELESESERDKKQRYGILSEEMERETWFIIVSVLSEWEGGVDYAVKGVDLESMIQEVLKKNQENGMEGEGGIEEGFVRYCLEKCISGNTNDNDGDGTGSGTVKLSVDYIARILAHCLFNARSTPWLEEEFMEEWQKLMPGVGDIYEPKLGLLKDIAIMLTSEEISPLLLAQMRTSTSTDDMNENDQQDQNQSQVYLKYFPRDGLPSDAKGRFKALFRERAKWKPEDIEPYLSDIVEKTPSISTVQEILIMHAIASPVPNENDGTDSTVMYIAK